MLRALAAVTLIGLGDSLNPSTVGPSVLFAMSGSPVRRVLEFAAGVFVVSLAGGVLLLLGPGQWLLDALPHAGAHRRHLWMIWGGAALIVVAVVFWACRGRLARKGLPGTKGGSRSAFATGAAIMAAELPTAFPYFGAIAVVVGAGGSRSFELALVALYNVLFVLPLLVIAVLLATVPSVRQSVLYPIAQWLDRNWPRVFAGLALTIGVGLTIAGIAGLSGE